MTTKWRQVPSRSSIAKTSPATSDLSRGSAQTPAKANTTSGPVEPLNAIQRPVLCCLLAPGVFVARVTPNQPELATQFGLYDNTYDIGTNSSECHNWLMMGDDPECNESQAGEYARSYDSEEDVLGHQRSGFLWTAVQAAGNSARNHGEFEYGEGKPGKAAVTDSPTWQQFYCATKAAEAGDASQLFAGDLGGASYGSPIPSLNTISNPASPSYDLSIPDIYREAVWEQDFQHQLATKGSAKGATKGAVAGALSFSMIWFSDDHTGPQAAPEAQVADNDLAVGRMVDTISHSKIWKSSAIFVAEDDSQAGVDHVDGHRAPIQVISPWAQHGKTVSTYYSRPRPRLSRFRSRSRGSPPWDAWAAQQHFSGAGAVADYANPELMNRYAWYRAHHWRTVYPGDSKILAPSEVPGAYVPNAEAD